MAPPVIDNPGSIGADSGENILVANSAPLTRQAKMDWHLEQAPTFHAYADDRTLLGVANAMDTLSSVFLLVVGLLGLRFLWRELRAGGSMHFMVREEMAAYFLLFGAVALTGIGSAFYHLAPDDARLLWDRLPMSLAFAAMLSSTIAERIRPGAGLRLLAPLALLSTASVVFWRVTGELLPYAIAQYGSIAAILFIVVRFRSRYSHAGWAIAVVAAYVVAKIAEAFDAWIYAIGHFISGHSLKHLFAAAAIWLVLDMLRRRRPAS